MNIDDLLNGFLKMPKTHEEAVNYIKKFPTMKASIEDMAFKQTVINILILAGLVTENDLNASVKHFEDQLYDQFANELLDMVDEIEKNKATGLEEVDLPDTEDNEEGWFPEDDPRVGKA